MCGCVWGVGVGVFFFEKKFPVCVCFFFDFLIRFFLFSQKFEQLQKFKK